MASDSIGLWRTRDVNQLGVDLVEEGLRAYAGEGVPRLEELLPSRGIRRTERTSVEQPDLRGVGVETLRLERRDRPREGLGTGARLADRVRAQSLRDIERCRGVLVLPRCGAARQGKNLERIVETALAEKGLDEIAVDLDHEPAASLERWW